MQVQRQPGEALWLFVEDCAALGVQPLQAAPARLGCRFDAAGCPLKQATRAGSCSRLEIHQRSGRATQGQAAGAV